MLKSSLKHLSKLSSLVICFELCFAPLALAQNSGRGQTNRVENRWKNTADAVGSISGLVMGAVNSYTQGQQGQMNSVEHFKTELAPMMRMTPINPQEIPAVFQGCIVLPAAGVTLTGGYSCMEADPARVDAGYATAVKDLAEQNMKDLQNFQTEGHARYTTQGVGCYNKKLDDYNATMAARQEELTAFLNNLTDRIENLTVPLQNADGSTRNVPIDQFLDLVKTDEALLTGKPARFIKDVKFENFLLDQNDLVCKTFISPKDIQQSSRRGGLRGIEEDVFTATNKTTDGHMSASEMLTKAKDIKNEVSTYGRELSKMAQRNDGLSLDTNDVTYSSRLSGTISNSLKRVATQFNAKMVQELKSLEQESDVNQAVAGNTQAAQILDGIKSGNTNFQARLGDYERISKSQCLRDSLKASFGSIESFATSFRDPSVSRRLAKEADNSLANRIVAEINQKDNDIEQIFTNIAKQEAGGGNSKKVFEPGKTFVIGDKQYGGLPMRASQLLGIFKNNCNERFQKVPNADGFTNQQVVAKLSEYGEKYNSLKRQAPNKIKTLLQDEIINCPQDKSTGSGDLSCNGALKANGPNFCVRTAVSCASNMNGCLEKSRSIVNDIKAKQDGKVKFLRQATDGLKNSIKNELAQLTKFYETQSRSLDAQLDIGTIFEMPEGMSYNLNADFSFGGKEAQGLNPEFNLEDPKKMLAQAQQKVKLLKDAVDKHSKAITKKLEDIRETYKQNYRDQERHWRNMIRDCDERNRMHMEEKAQIEEERLANQEEIDRACQEIRTFNAGNDCDTVGELMQTVQESAVIASRQAAQDPSQPDPGSIQRSTASAIAQLGQVRRLCGRSERTGYRSRPVSQEEVQNYCRINGSGPECSKRKEAIAAATADGGICPDGMNLDQALEVELAERLGVDDFDSNTPFCIKKVRGQIEDIDNLNVDGECDNNDFDRGTLSNFRGNSEKALIARCYDPNDLPSAVNTAQNAVITLIQNEEEEDPTSQMGENQVQVSVAQCNAQGDGFFGAKGFGDMLNQAAGAIGRGAAGVQENGARNVLGN